MSAKFLLNIYSVNCLYQQKLYLNTTTATKTKHLKTVLPAKKQIVKQFKVI